MNPLKYILGISVLFFGLLISCQKDASDLLAEQSALKSEMDQYILEKVKSSNTPFDWNLESDERIYQALTLTDNILVIGYSDGIQPNLNARDAILNYIYQLENKSASKIGELDEVLIYKEDVLGFVSVKISKLETLQKVRKMPEVTFVEVNGYPIDMEVIRAFTGTTPSSAQHKSNGSNVRTEMILDPFLLDPEYAQQVLNYDNTLGVVLQRHNIDEVYRQYQNFGEGVGMAVIDNGIVPFALELFEANGYGERYTLGYHNPLWFLPWEANNNDGIAPLETDALGLAALFEAQVLHGSGMIQSAFVVAPNANIYSVRASTAIVILFPSQVYGISKAIRAIADRPEVKVTNMSMGTFFYIHRIAMSINYYHSKGKIMGSAAGTSFEEIKDLLGVIFPANLPTTVAVTGIEDRTATNGVFQEGSTAHTGAQVDFCVEKSAASSEATARMVGMFALIWSANPNLTRDEVMDIAIRASHFYQLQGSKDPKFGWGTVDALQAVEMAMAE